MAVAIRLCLCGSKLMSAFGSDHRQNREVPVNRTRLLPQNNESTQRLPSSPQSKMAPMFTSDSPNSGATSQKSAFSFNVQNSRGNFFAARSAASGIQTQQQVRRHSVFSVVCRAGIGPWKHMRIAWDGNDGIPDGLTMVNRSSKWMVPGIWVMMYVSVPQS